MSQGNTGNPQLNDPNAESQRLPISLKIVALVWGLKGAALIFDIFQSASNILANVCFGTIMCFVGIGLIRLNSYWRNIALILTWLSWCFVLLATLRHSGFTITFAANSSFEFQVFLFVAALVYSVWQYRVLTRPRVRALFGLTSGN
jgi:hypothetical protein